MGKVKECREMIDYLLGLAQDGKLKYELVFFLNKNSYLPWKTIFSYHLNQQLVFSDRTELVPFDEFPVALGKALGKLGRQPKQVITF